MVSISLINPMDQPTGRNRLLHHLVGALTDKQFTSFRFVVAFAKVGPLQRMKTVIDAGRAAGLKIEAIFGLDHQGTSAQALQFALDNFDAVYVIQEQGHTFHPKMYVFEGTKSARLYVGSNNLTVGGTETNFESSLRLDLTLPNDASTLKLFTDCWNEMLPAGCPATKKLTASNLTTLVLDNTAPDETVMRKAASAASKGSSAPRPLRSGLKTKPASTLPPRKAVKAPTSASSAPSPAVAASAIAPTSHATKSTSPIVDPVTAQGLAIQIKPHHNGEIFLSVTAALQNPKFFGWPFTGSTVPKKAGNPAYPQLSPDPPCKYHRLRGAACANFTTSKLPAEYRLLRNEKRDPRYCVAISWHCARLFSHDYAQE